MSENKAIMARVYEQGFSQGDVDLIDELMADDFVEHEELPPGVPTGKGAARALVSMMHSAFPDFHVTVEEMLEDGDKVITRARFSGTHEGDCPARLIASATRPANRCHCPTRLTTSATRPANRCHKGFRARSGHERRQG